ncbi:MAG: hypothetical protein U5L09_23185 [Bacteroidales bacterium]|nr:hypothetical protein [Bacteroidales bacterium]
MTPVTYLSSYSGTGSFNHCYCCCCGAFGGASPRHGLLKPKYRNPAVIMYPASSNSLLKHSLPSARVASRNILEYGEEAATEQMLQLLNSSRIRNRVVRKFDLMAHYDIAPDDKYRF